MSIGKILTGIGLLIMLYLFVANPTATVNIINSLGQNAASGIKTLQGRPV